jgi:hypothetical protein
MRLKEKGISKSGPAFYQLMGRLEEVKFVKGWYEQQIIDGQIIKERHYQILGNGLRSLNSVKVFYTRILEEEAGMSGVAPSPA